MTKIANGFDRNKELDEQLASMATADLDTILLNLQIQTKQKKKDVLNVDTTKYITPWTSHAGRAYAKWTAQMLVEFPNKIPTKDENFLRSILMKAIMLDKDNVHHLRWLGNRYKINPTTGDEQRDASIWSYIYGHVTWKEMKMGKSVAINEFGENKFHRYRDNK